MSSRFLLLSIALLASATIGLFAPSAAASDDQPALEKLLKLRTDGNYKEAYDGLSQFVLERKGIASPDLVKAFDAAIVCLQQLNHVDEIDAFREKAVDAHKNDWQLLAAVAQSYLTCDHYGFMIAGEFHRGPHRGGGKVVHATARDRVHALRLFRGAMKLAQTAGDKRGPAGLLRQFAEAITYGNESWRLQTLTNLDKLPDYEEGWGYSGTPQGAPVDEHGNPIFYSIPKTWDSAKNDGERWRWLLETMVEWQPSRRNDERLLRARFLQSQFGVQTLAQFGLRLPEHPDGETNKKDDATGIWALNTLGDNESIARLAIGVKRFKLPDEHNFIKLYQQVVESTPIKTSAAALDAIRSLAQLFENRRQYPRAAEYWRMGVERASGDDQRQFQQRLDQVVGNWGRFESVMTQPAGRGATVDFRFRNAKSIQFVAHEIDIQKLLDDVKAYLKSKPKQLEWDQVNVSDIGYRLVQANQKKYVGAEVARWKLELQPGEKHFDKRITVTTPLQKAGAYLVTANVQGGNASQIVLWLADTAIIRKPMPDKSFYFVADAMTGDPVPKANIEFFGYRQRHVDGNQYELETKDIAENTDKNGETFLPIPDEKQDPAAREFQWIAIATTPAGRLAYIGFHNVWQSPYYESQYNAVKTFTITDRPVYRPGQTVQFKFWIRHAQYDAEDKSEFAHQSFVVEIRDPRNEKVYSQTLTSDNYGGIAGKFELPESTTLGQYQLIVVNRGGGTFRVEEYKKPEYEVTVEAPTEPVTLGETIKAKIRAKYYFGSPVVNATVRYKVLRSVHNAHWYPPEAWDWLYGPGYSWLAPDYTWFPDWNDWGCERPVPPWFWIQPSPPEIVVEREVPIGSDGTVNVQIDTSIAKALHPDDDERYSIEAEVVDQSRRTIVGHGDVLVARQPFRVCAWVDRGYYRVGDTIKANLAARRIDGKPVEGTGKLRLLKITYGPAPDRKPIETEVRSWTLPTNAEGNAEIQVTASEKGQYRLSYKVTDKAGHEIEGGYLFTIIGEGFDGSDFRFNNLELVPDKAEYAPNEKVQLQINTNHVNSTVLLFVRPSNGVYLPPQLLHLAGKSMVVDLGVTQQDMPNFFIEAMTVANGRAYTEVRDIHVPPAKRILNMEVVASAPEYKPGQHAKITVKVKDAAGKPYVGSVVVSIFDKSLEYISGGSNVADIKEFFWKWRREHRPYLETNLDHWFNNLVPPKQKQMQDLGIFGESVADESTTANNFDRTAGPQAGIVARNRLFLGAAMTKAPMPGAPPTSPMSAANLSGEAKKDIPYEAPAISPPTAQPPAGQLVQPTIRSEFADTALWAPSLETNKDGIAVTELDMPQNLTTWKIQAWGMGQGTRVGEASAEVITRKNLIVRMQAPRFLVERDEAVLSANVHNYLSTAKQVKVHLELDGKALELPAAAEKTVDIPAGGEKRVDWRVKAVHEGEAVIRVLALTDEESDAVENKIPVFVHGMLKTDSFTGSLRPDERQGAFEVTVPRQRRADQTRLEVRYSPTLAGAMVDALPYLIDYPYGCTEQTLNRFLPAVITQQTLLRLKLNLKAIHQKRTNLNAQEIGDAVARAKDWKRYKDNPVFDEAELSIIVKAGVNRLQEMQLSDGGWGWFSGWGEQSTAHMTATVVHGLEIARQNDVALVPGVLERGIEWLKQYQQEQLRLLSNVDAAGHVIDKHKPYKLSADNIDALAYMVLSDADIKNDAMRDRLYRDRTKLSVYGLATYGLALNKQHDAQKLAMIMRNISQYVVQDNENQTAFLNIPQNIWWYWYGSEFEAEAYYLKLLVATDPKNPIAPRLVKYLVNNRKHATYWNSTRDTALVIEALADYIQATGENKPDLTVEVWIDGQKRKEAKIDADNLFTFDNAFVLEGDALTPGRHTIELRKSGKGPLYWNGYLTNFTLENDIHHAGLDLKVDRHYYKLTPINKSIEVAGGRGQVVGQRVEKYDRNEIRDLGTVRSGDLIEVELVVDSKNDYEYILLDDMKAAGCEPVALQSGYNGNELGAYMELRDARVTLFIRNLARGRHSVSYRVRAETPGLFSALPTKASAMYAPELRGNSDELKLHIEDTGEPKKNP
ncbi:MAG TPA: MG2 domain-containing protein [Lacipirellulaceae bacterium]|nr:MG2 domain-containing protein [Lacipirellulaceae bacterium]